MQITLLSRKWQELVGGKYMSKIFSIYCVLPNFLYLDDRGNYFLWLAKTEEHEALLEREITAQSLLQKTQNYEGKCFYELDQNLPESDKFVWAYPRDKGEQE